uniref:Uncharacterized protein n=1 Tax=Anguilla anguilla TaxID=7936 RepID=A0A0E9TUM9_ANGAN
MIRLKNLSSGFKVNRAHTCLGSDRTMQYYIRGGITDGQQSSVNV